MPDTPLRERLAAAAEGNEWGLFLVTLGVLFFAGGSVLSGDGVGSELWALPVVGLCVVVIVLLAYQVVKRR